MLFSPLDISFYDRSPDQTDVVINNYDSDIQGLNMIKYEEQYKSTPVATIEWLIKDLSDNITDPIKVEERKSVGKHEKDRARYERMIYLKDHLTNEEKKVLVTKMDQVSPVSAESTEVIYDIQNMLKCILETFNICKLEKSNEKKIETFLEKLNDPVNAFSSFLSKYIGQNATSNSIQNYVSTVLNIDKKSITSFKNYELVNVAQRDGLPINNIIKNNSIIEMKSPPINNYNTRKRKLDSPPINNNNTRKRKS
jgi:hypothetical protein